MRDHKKNPIEQMRQELQDEVAKTREVIEQTRAQTERIRRNREEQKLVIDELKARETQLKAEMSEAHESFLGAIRVFDVERAEIHRRRVERLGKEQMRVLDDMAAAIGRLQV